jgi:hypothetical protein
MNNTLLAIDMMNVALNTMIRINALLQRAQQEGRDVTDDEIAQLRSANDQLEEELLS